MEARLPVPLHFARAWPLLRPVAFLALALALVAGCGGSDGPPTTDVQLRIDFSLASGSLQLTLPAGIGSRPLAATVNDIAAVTVDVLQGTTPLQTAVPLTRDPDTGVWSGTLSGLPVGVSLLFVAHAYDATPTEIFSGSTSVTLTGAADAVTIAMAATEPPGTTLPRIVSIQVPGQVGAAATAEVTFVLGGNVGDTLTWQTTSGGGTFAPPGGSIDLSTGTVSVVVSYTALDAAGTYTHTLRVTNGSGNAVEATFSIVVSDGTAGVTLQFFPVVTSILGSRANGTNTVTWTATVVDDGGPLAYSWSADVTGGTAPAFRGLADTNPAYLDGYDQSVDGTLTFQVSDTDDHTTMVTITLPAGQFPDNLVVTAAQGLTYLDGDGIPEMTDVPWLDPSPFGPGDTVTLFVPVDSDVGYLAACVYAFFADAGDLGQPTDRGCTSQWSVAPALGTATQDLVLDGALPASAQYWILVVTCLSVAECDTATGTIYTSDAGSSTYSRQAWVAGAPVSSVDTGVPIPTFSSPGGALGFQATDGDGVAEMTGAPVPEVSTVSITTDTSMVINVPVDADAGSVCVDVGAGYNLGSGWPGGSEGSGCAAVTGPLVPVTVTFGVLTEGVHTMTVSVGLDPPGPDNTNTSWNYASTKNPGTFRIVKYPGSTSGVEFETGAPIPTFDVLP